MMKQESCDLTAWTGELLAIASLQPIAQRRELRAWIEQRSEGFQTHPLGFVQLKWSEGSVPYRLNIWSAKLGRRKQPDWRIHNHMFAFESAILVGSLEERRFVEIEAGPPTHRAYEVAYGEASSHLTATSRLVSLSCVEIKRYFSGQRYSVSPGVCHDTISEADFSASLMKLGPALDRLPTVYGDINGPLVTPDYATEMLDSMQILNAMR
jgi:hypothetical protein